MPFVPRGAGTSLAGGTLPVGGGVMICTTRMKQILETKMPLPAKSGIFVYAQAYLPRQDPPTDNLLALIKRRLSNQVMREVLQETTKTTAFIFAVLLGATAFSLVLRGLGGDELIERVLLDLPFEPTGIIICILLATFLLGFFLDWIELTLIVLPLVSPVVTGLGFDPVWFTILFAVCLQTSFLTPPVGFAPELVPGEVGWDGPNPVEISWSPACSCS